MLEKIFSPRMRATAQISQTRYRPLRGLTILIPIGPRVPRASSLHPRLHAFACSAGLTTKRHDCINRGAEERGDGEREHPGHQDSGDHSGVCFSRDETNTKQ